MSRTAFMIIDVLSGIFHLDEPIYRQEEFLRNIAGLLDRARVARVPVVHIQHRGPKGSLFGEGAPGRAIHPRVAPAADEIVIGKEHPDAFQDSPLERILRENKIDRLVICGFATEACVDTTVRSAYARGFSVVLVSDGHTTTRNRVLEADRIMAHHNLVLARFARLQRADEIDFALTVETHKGTGS